MEKSGDGGTLQAFAKKSPEDWRGKKGELKEKFVNSD